MTSKTVERPRLPRKQAAPYINRAKSTLDKYASRGKGPPYHKVGGRIYYWISDLDEFNKKAQTF